LIEGYLTKQKNGRYAINGAEFTSGDCLEVKIVPYWVTMRIEHDGHDYYLLNDGLAFYPKKVYARYD